MEKNDAISGKTLIYICVYLLIKENGLIMKTLLIYIVSGKRYDFFMRTLYAITLPLFIFFYSILGRDMTSPRTLHCSIEKNDVGKEKTLFYYFHL